MRKNRYKVEIIFLSLVIVFELLIEIFYVWFLCGVLRFRLVYLDMLVFLIEILIFEYVLWGLVVNVCELV